MRPVFGSTATTDPLYRPSASTAAARTTGSSKVEMSSLEESAKVGTPRYREAYLRVRAVEVAPLGAAGTGTANSDIIKSARTDLAAFFTEPPFGPRHPPINPRGEYLPHPVLAVNLLSLTAFYILRCKPQR